MKNIFFVFLLPFSNLISQNIFNKNVEKLSDIELKVSNNLIMASHIYDVPLSKQDAPVFIIKAINKNDSHIYPTTYIAIKFTENLTYTILFEVIEDTCKYGIIITHDAYVGSIKKQYGEFKNELLEKKTKKRLYPENNIYTETVSLSNGIILTIENRIYVTKVYVPNQKTYEMPLYEYGK